jgi:hypothetical protein
MRQFKTGSIRDTNQGKISYYGFRHPLVEHSFGKYMLKHQKQADGKLRSPNNWWGGWSEDISIDSLIRHAEDLQAIHAGYTVVKIRHNDEEITEYIKPVIKGDLTFSSISTPRGAIVTEVTKEDCYNAIKFNCNAGLLEHLKINRK